MNTTLDAVLDYHSRGWFPIPVPMGLKKPIIEGWQNLRLTREDLPIHFSNGTNIGLLLGKPSANLIDIDLDWHEAQILADRFLPETHRVSGRKSAPCSHFFYTVESVAKTKQFEAPILKNENSERAMIVEFRSTGAQTIVPPSRHPSGEDYVWHQEGETAKVSSNLLMKSVSTLAACALLARHWQYGQRHNTALALSSVLLRAGWSVAEAQHFILSAANAANDEEAQDRIKNVITTQQRIESGEPFTGLPKLIELLGERIVEKLRLWLDFPSSTINSTKLNGRAPTPTIERKSLKVICLADVQPEQVEFLWHPYIPKGKLTFIEGDPGVGKSWLTCALATATAAGKGIAGWNHSEPSNVLILSAEDGLSDTIRPRLDSMNADVKRIFAIEGAFTFNQPGLLELEEKIIAFTPALVIIDPIVAYMGAGVDMHRANETRSITSPLADLAYKYGCAFVIVRHLTKGGKDKAIYRGIGSIDFTASCRSALLVGFDPDNQARRIIAHIKSNLAEPGTSIGYEIRDGVFYWTGESSITAEQMLSANNSNSSAETQEAEEFLKQVLAEGEMQSKEVQKEARSLGITEWQLRAARKRLGIQSKKKGQPGQKYQCWMWALPHSTEDEELTFFSPEDEKENTSTHLRANSDTKNLYTTILAEDEGESFATHLRDESTHLRDDFISCPVDGRVGKRLSYCDKCGEFLH